jgi:hypothetical protein
VSPAELEATSPELLEVTYDVAVERAQAVEKARREAERKRRG